MTSIITWYTTWRRHNLLFAPTASVSVPMILRSFSRLPTVLLAVLLLFVPSSLAEDGKPFDCRVNVNGTKFDLTPLAGAHTVNRTRVTSPTTTIDVLRFDLCDDLKQLADVPESDQVRHLAFSHVS